MLWCLCGDATRTALRTAHRAALGGQALAFVEHSVIRARVGEVGCRQVTTHGMIAAALDHWDTRAGDFSREAAAFRTGRLRIWATVRDWNDTSLREFARLGFQRE